MLKVLKIEFDVFSVKKVMYPLTLVTNVLLKTMIFLIVENTKKTQLDVRNVKQNTIWIVWDFVRKVIYNFAWPIEQKKNVFYVFQDTF